MFDKYWCSPVHVMLMALRCSVKSSYNQAFIVFDHFQLLNYSKCLLLFMLSPLLFLLKLVSSSSITVLRHYSLLPVFYNTVTVHYSIYFQVIGEILKKLSPTMDTQRILETFLFSFSTLTIAFLFRYLLCQTQFLL